MKLYLQTESIPIEELKNKDNLVKTLLLFSINDPDMLSDSKLSEEAKETYITYGEYCAVESIDLFYPDPYNAERTLYNTYMLQSIMYSFVGLWFNDDPDILDRCQCKVNRVDDSIVISLAYVI